MSFKETVEKVISWCDEHDIIYKMDLDNYRRVQDFYYGYDDFYEDDFHMNKRFVVK